ncbi:unnamed protein product [Coregonus sp. 'balchen']|nr:unnamed protein product [Coregonus sp. 'balchen']
MLISISSDITTVNSWIQVNLGETKKVTGVVIQGCKDADHWVTKFKIQHNAVSCDAKPNFNFANEVPASTTLYSKMPAQWPRS